MSWVQAARAAKGEGRQHNGHTQRSKLSMDHMQSKRHSACVDQFHVNANQPHYGFRARLFTRVRPSFFTDSQCRKHSESSQSAVRSHDVCCRLVDANAPQSSGRHCRMRMHLDWWRKVRPPPRTEPTDILCVRLETKQAITFKDRVITSNLLG